MKPVFRALTVGVAAASLGGCGYFFGDDGYFRDRGSDYQLAVVKPRMEVPPGVDSKPIGDLLPVPGQVVTGTGEYETPRPQSMQTNGNASEFSVQQDGSKRWLQAQRSPAEVWSLLQQFLSDYRVPVAEAKPELGEVQTAWQAFEGTSNPLMRRLAAGFSEGRGIDDLEQRLRIRVEPGVRSGTSEIHVLQMTRREAGNEAQWPKRSHDSNVESAMLAELETYLNQSGGDDVASLAASRLPVADRSELVRDGAGNPVLRMSVDFNRAWAAVGTALEQSDVVISDLNRSAGVYYVDLSETVSERKGGGFFAGLFGRGKSDENEGEGRVQVRLTEIGNEIQVTVDEGVETATDPAVARDLLVRIRDNLG